MLLYELRFEGMRLILFRRRLGVDEHADGELPPALPWPRVEDTTTGRWPRNVEGTADSTTVPGQWLAGELTLFGSGMLLPLAFGCSLSHMPRVVCYSP